MDIDSALEDLMSFRNIDAYPHRVVVNVHFAPMATNRKRPPTAGKPTDQDVEKWLSDHGLGPSSVLQSGRYWQDQHSNENRIEIAFAFKDPVLATLFKLTFG